MPVSDEAVIDASDADTDGAMEEASSSTSLAAAFSVARCDLVRAFLEGDEFLYLVPYK